MKTLVIVSHPYADQSVAIHALQKVVENMTDVTVRNLETLYGDDASQIDVAVEQKAHEDADRIVYLYPTHWFNLTPMLKSYLNQVWAFGWAFGPEGTALKGKEMQIITTAGASEFTYSHQGLIKSTMDEVLSPMKASALYVGMHYNHPIAFFGMISEKEARISDMQTIVTQRLTAPLGSAIQI